MICQAAIRDDERGSVLILSAVSVAAVCVLLVGLLQTADWMATRRTLQAGADAAALAAAGQIDQLHCDPACVSRVGASARTYARWHTGVALEPCPAPSCWQIVAADPSEVEVFVAVPHQLLGRTLTIRVHARARRHPAPAPRPEARSFTPEISLAQ